MYFLSKYKTFSHFIPTFKNNNNNKKEQYILSNLIKID